MRRSKDPFQPSRLTLLAGAVGAFTVTFALALYGLDPGAPGRPDLDAYLQSRLTDQHFADCGAARAAGRENIPWFDPSYRAEMDGDGDGFACESRHGGVRRLSRRLARPAAASFNSW